MYKNSFLINFCKQNHSKTFLSGLIYIVAFLLLSGLAKAEIDISDSPFDVGFRAAPTTVMFLLDDSGSMDFEFMTSENDGNFDGNYYVFSHDNAHSGHQATKTAWKAQWAGYNKIYYNPKTDYKPWVSNGAGGEFPDAHMKTPKSNPVNIETFTLSDEFYSVELAGEEITDWLESRVNQRSSSEQWEALVIDGEGEFEISSKETWVLSIERVGDGGSSDSTLLPAVRFLDAQTNQVVKIIYPNDANNSDGDEYNEFGSGFSTSSSTSPKTGGGTVNNRWTVTNGEYVLYTPSLSAGDYKIEYYCSTHNVRDPSARFIVTNHYDDPPLSDTTIVQVKKSHYFLLDDSGGGVDANKNNGVVDSGETIYLVNIDGSDLDVNHVEESDIQRTYYRLTSHDGEVDNGELASVAILDIPELIRPPESKIEDLQNFANWYSYYRRRGLTAKSSVGRVISGLKGLSVGLYSLHERTTQTALSVKITNSDGIVDDNTDALLAKLYAGTDSGETPLRSGLESVGKYFMGTNTAFAPTPYENADKGGSCQQVYAIVMADGYWSGGDSFDNYNDRDGDGVSNTLADIARYYYDTDLRSRLPNAVPTNACDPNAQQHMVTYGVSFGVTGTINPEDYNSCTYLDTNGNAPAWPNMTQEKHKVDDLFHAAVNSKGEFFTASNPEALVQSLKTIFAGIAVREITGSPVAVSAEKLYSSSHLFQGSYLKANWTGDVESYLISYDSSLKGITIGAAPVWKASEELANLTPETRKIITFNPRDKSGSRFRWEELSASQKNQLLGYDASRAYVLADPENSLGEKLVEFIRGSEDYSEFRNRPVKLGDIVHSSPVMIDGNLFVGANDGMLHAFDTTTGVEAFAYIPNLVYKNLNLLPRKDYTHKFFVDQTPTYAKIFNKTSKKHEKYVLGGLGKGGKGYYCLNITDLKTAIVSENTAAAMVAWEFTDDQMGYSYSEPAVVQTKSDDYPYIVIVGNGYNSPAGEGAFYILDLQTGELIKKLSTEVAGGNGVSSPIAIDVNNDYVADYAFAGDLKGHLWKLDFSSADTDDWDFAFFDGTKPAPLFTTMANQPITSRPDVARHCKYQGYLVAFGTGKYLGLSDLDTDYKQAMYAVWDYGDDSDDGECLGEFSGDMTASSKVSKHPDGSVDEIDIRVQMLYHNPGAPTEIGSGAMTKSTGSEFATWQLIADKDDPNPNHLKDGDQQSNPIRDIGWFLPMNLDKERIVQDPMIISGTLLFLSKVPVPGICSGGGYSMLYSLGICDGGALEFAWSTPDRKELTMPVLVNTPDGEKLIFGKGGAGAGGGRIDKDLAGSKIPKGIYYWQEIIDIP